ncbi:MAG: DUF4230 domain-containing protein [Oscillospiraceae bacterium]|nr:DUF4230 domain-containing protein [Oscillospiraceae bacterium]
MKTEKSKTKGILLILLSLVLLAAIAYVVATSLSGQKTELPTITPRPTAEVVIREKEVEKIVETEKRITSDVIQDGLREMGFLLTEEYYFTEVVSFSSIKKFLIEWKFTESSFLASYDGVVSAGIDCSRITVEKDDEKKEIVIGIPEAQARPADIDPNSLIVYSEKEGTGNHISIQDYNNSLIELENAAEEKAVERGVLDRANANAEKMIRSFVGSLVDLSEYSLTFERLP